MPGSKKHDAIVETWVEAEACRTAENDEYLENVQAEVPVKGINGECAACALVNYNTKTFNRLSSLIIPSNSLLSTLYKHLEVKASTKSEQSLRAQRPPVFSLRLARP